MPMWSTCSQNEKDYDAKGMMMNYMPCVREKELGKGKKVQWKEGTWWMRGKASKQHINKMSSNFDENIKRKLKNIENLYFNYKFLLLVMI